MLHPSAGERQSTLRAPHGRGTAPKSRNPEIPKLPRLPEHGWGLRMGQGGLKSCGRVRFQREGGQPRETAQLLHLEINSKRSPSLFGLGGVSRDESVQWDDTPQHLRHFRPAVKKYYLSCLGAEWVPLPSDTQTQSEINPAP